MRRPSPRATAAGDDRDVPPTPLHSTKPTGAPDRRLRAPRRPSPPRPGTAAAPAGPPCRRRPRPPRPACDTRRPRPGRHDPRDRLVERAGKPDRPSVRETRPDQLLPRLIDEPEARELQLLGHVDHDGVVDGSPLQPMTGRQGFGPHAAARLIVGLEHGHAHARAREEGGAGEAVVAPADDDQFFCSHECPDATRPARSASSRARGRQVSIARRSSMTVIPSASSRRPSTHTSATERGLAQ